MVKNLPCNAGDLNLIPGQGTKVAYAMWCGKKKKKKERNCILESPDKNVHLVMLIKKSGTKLIKILSKECYKYIKSMKRQKAERKYIKMV